MNDQPATPPAQPDGARAHDLPRAVETAYRQLRQMILQGSLAAGQALPEQELAAQLGVSRTPVREAIGRLRAEGLVEMERYKKHFVAHFGEEDRVEIYELKALIEGRAAYRATSRLSPADLARMDELTAAMEAGVAAQGDGFMPVFDRLNREFHAIIWRAAGSPRSERILASALSAPFNVLGRYSRALGPSMQRANWYHREIVAAFHARDPDRARAQMSAHLLSLISTDLQKRVYLPAA